MILGLTGPTGAGKTTIALIFSKYGAKVIDADKISHAVLQNGTDAYRLVISEFDNIVSDNGHINRKKLAHIVFSNPLMLDKLNKIVFPYIKDMILDKINDFKDERLVVLDAPTLLQSKLDEICDKIVVVLSQYNKIKERIICRDNLSSKMAENRIRNQLRDIDYINKADYIISNNYDIDNELDFKVKMIIDEIFNKGC